MKDTGRRVQLSVIIQTGHAQSFVLHLFR